MGEAIIAISLVIIIIILIIKFFLKPLFFEPKLGLTELLELLESKGEILIEKKSISKKEFKNSSFFIEMDFFDKMYSESYYQIECYNDNSKSNKNYILILRKSNNFFGKREIELFETSEFN